MSRFLWFTVYKGRGMHFDGVALRLTGFFCIWFVYHYCYE